MQAHTTYKHINNFCTYNIHILKVRYSDAKQIKIQLVFVNKADGSLTDLIPHKGRILRENISEWSVVADK